MLTEVAAEAGTSGKKEFRATNITGLADF